MESERDMSRCTTPLPKHWLYTYERPRAMAMCLDQCDGSVRDRFAACLDRVCSVYYVHVVLSGCLAPVGFDDARAVPL